MLTRPDLETRGLELLARLIQAPPWDHETEVMERSRRSLSGLRRGVSRPWNQHDLLWHATALTHAEEDRSAELGRDDFQSQRPLVEPPCALYVADHENDFGEPLGRDHTSFSFLSNRSIASSPLPKANLGNVSILE